jgi:hypothetical protein
MLMLAVVLGCASHGKAPGTPVAPSSAPVTVASLAGEYALVTVDGKPLPYAVNATARPIVSGSLSLKTSGTFQLQTAFEDAGAKSAAAFSGACYTEGNDVKMVWDGGLANLTFRGDTVLLKRDGALYAYLRSR